MKDILSKIAGVMTMFAMTFGVALAAPAEKMTICHFEGNGSSHTIEINANAWPAHQQNHGDYQGPCIEEDGDNDTQCTLDCEPEGPVCPEGNLLANGGFEAPVAPLGGWDEYDSGTPGLGWTVAWNGAFGGAPATAKLELHNGVNGWLPYAGSQHAELDADWGYNNNEQASVAISQDVVTVPGATYELSYAFSPRPATGAGENILEVLVEGSLVQTQGPVAGVGNTSWNTYSYEFVAADALTTIAFRDAGTPNTLGTFIDDVSLNCEQMPEEETCPAYEQVMARINFAKVAKGAQVNGWRNWPALGGGADMAPKVYVGGNTLAHQYDDEEWFPLTNPDGTYINDLDFSFDVPGIAVQRYEGKVRVVLFGSHTLENGELGNKEFTQGVLEIGTNAAFEAGLMSPLDQSNLNTNPRTHDPYVNDAQNPMDGRGKYKGGIDQYDPRFDKMRTLNSQKIAFHLVVTTGNDGFYGHYDTDIDCIEDQIPQ